jgi:hypothetical protein
MSSQRKLKNETYSNKKAAYETKTTAQEVS